MYLYLAGLIQDYITMGACWLLLDVVGEGENEKKREQLRIGQDMGMELMLSW